ncbi:MAG: CHC2 zinc finger domain-containing protein [Candidatus Zhuqueibacterota bacterium]
MLKSSVKMEDLLSRLNFKKMNLRNKRSACLIHGGDNPNSFAWNDDTFYCYSYNQHGDKIELVQLVKHYSFLEAVRFLCAISGYEIYNNNVYENRRVDYSKREIPEFVVKRVKNQNYDLLQFESKIKEIEKKIEIDTDILITMKNEREKYRYFIEETDQRLNQLDSELNYLIFEKHQILKS